MTSIGLEVYIFYKHWTVSERECLQNWSLGSYFQSKSRLLICWCVFNRCERTGIIYQDGRKVSYEYYELSRLSKTVNADGQMALYKYCGLGYRIEKVVYIKERSANCICIWGNTDYQKEWSVKLCRFRRAYAEYSNI